MAQSFEFSPLPLTEQQEFQASLAAHYATVPDYITQSEMWTPYYHSESEAQQLVKIQGALQIGLRALLQQAPHEPRLTALLSPRLDEHAQERLSAFAGQPLGAQLIRPDYIYNNGQPQICEINTRFMFNGNILGVHMAKYLASKSEVDITNYQRLDAFMHGTYDGDRDTVFVRGQERIHDLSLQMQRSGTDKVYNPSEIETLNPANAARMVLELHQHELEPVLAAIAERMSAGITAYNDPRVIHVLHDKRLLVALSDFDYMTGLVGPDAAATLAAGVIPSYHPLWEGREPECAPGKVLLAKGAISGKGSDQLMVSKDSYHDRFIDPNAYVYQQRHAQPRLTTPGGQQVEIAGTLPMTLEGDVFGAGIVRVVPYRRLRSFLGFSVAIQELS